MVSKCFLRAQLKYAQYWHKDDDISEPSVYPQPIHPYRSAFACDRDRVLYNVSFRRLGSKTQVFNSSTTDCLRTRLTHTLEVAQISRTITAKLGLDTDLTEAISLAHDIGHTPFGHVGERTLNDFSQGKNGKTIINDPWKDKKTEEEQLFIIPKNNYGFKHNLQALRVLVDYSAKDKFSNYLMYGVREHSKTFWNKPEDVAFYSRYDNYCCYVDRTTDKKIPAWSFEAFVVEKADEIAQRHHDLEDAFLENIIPPKEIVKFLQPLADIVQQDYLTEKFKKLTLELPQASKEKDSFVKTLSTFLVDAYVTLTIDEFENHFAKFCEKYNVHSSEDFEQKFPSIPEEDIKKMFSFSDSDIFRIDKTLGDSLKHSVIDSFQVQRMDGKGAYIVRKLMRAYISNPQQLPSKYINKFIQKELKRYLDSNNYQNFISKIKDKMSITVAANVNTWPDYACREALRVISKNERLFNDACPALFRIIFDYIGGMSDSYASSQFAELYGK